MSTFENNLVLLHRLDLFGLEVEGDAGWSLGTLFGVNFAFFLFLLALKCKYYLRQGSQVFFYPQSCLAVHERQFNFIVPHHFAKIRPKVFQHDYKWFRFLLGCLLSAFDTDQLHIEFRVIIFQLVHFFSLLVKVFGFGVWIARFN